MMVFYIVVGVMIVAAGPVSYYMAKRSSRKWMDKMRRDGLL